MPEKLTLNKEELYTMLKEASEKGASSALAKVGLDDKDAIKDILEIRSILDSYRWARRSMISALVKGVVLIVITAVVTYFGFMGGK